MRHLQILPAGPEHAAAVHAIAASVVYRPDTADGECGFLVLPETPAWWTATFAQPNASCVAVIDGTVAGFLYALVEDGGEVLKIDRIAVHRSCRRRGVAQALLDTVLDWARPARAYALIMHAPVRNNASVAFFRDANGFELVDRIDEASPFAWGRYEASQESPRVPRLRQMVPKAECR
jgi:ribosomal protein S18 acetylase RimI-like enzyme